MNTKTKLPKWFKGELYEEGDMVRNPFSGEEYKLTGAELSMYDFIIGSQLVMEMAPRMVEPRQIADFQKGLDWFRQHNAKAYMVLLD
jgi:hypothetical protein